MDLIDRKVAKQNKALQANYRQWLKTKAVLANESGFEPSTSPHESLKPHQVDSVYWAIKKGRAGLFLKFGLGKTRCQLQLMKWVHEHTGGQTLIVAPLGVRQEFTRQDAPAMGLDLQYVKNDAEVFAATTPYLITNYERVVNGDIDIGQFEGISLDEASCLRSYGTLTTQTMCERASIVPYRFVATATPSPNDYIELINYAHFLGTMDRGQALTRWFGRDSKEAGNLKLYATQEEQFWLWVASWGLFLYEPGDLGHSNENYSLPRLNVRWHPVGIDYSRAFKETDGRGQHRLLPETSGGITHVSKERRATLSQRVEKAFEIIQDDMPSKHWLVWHYLEDERKAIQKVLPDSKAVFGSQNLEEREDLIIGFSNGDYRILSTKPEIAGSGCNFQRYCSDAIFIGPTDKFNDFIQAVHRLYRFMQPNEVNVHIIFAETQQETVSIMKRKWAQHDRLAAKMQSIVKRYGLNHEAMQMRLERQMGCERVAVHGERFTVVNNDCVDEAMQLASDSIDQIVTSIPFGDHYEYSASYNDFGHNQGDERFFEQMDFVIPQWHRILKPGRVACIHVKDRITYGKVTGSGMYGCNPFSDKTVAAFINHGWHFMGRIVIDTDVVRENAQTYRLGWTENAKDSTKMGVGSNEYVLVFRKWTADMSPDNTANGPFPVNKDNSEYTRSRWQIQASGTWRSSGNELLSPAQLASMSDSQIYHFWKNHATTHGYDYHNHVKWSEIVEGEGKLPSSSMLFAPHSKNPDVWVDVLRIKTLNTEQRKKIAENHICPLQLDVIERLIERYSNPGDLIYDPFNGIGSTVYQAIKMGRKGYGTELSAEYWKHSVGYCEQAEEEMSAPTLFDLMSFSVA
jgi:DNA modification methylase